MNHLPKEKCSECQFEEGHSHGCSHFKESNRWKRQTPAPEKKWEAAFVEEWGMELPNLEIRKQVIAFIRQLLEEKAVEVEGLKVDETDPSEVVSAGLEGFNKALTEAAAILRR